MSQKWHHSIDYGGGSLVAYGNTLTTGNHFFNVYAQRYDSTGTARSAGAFVETMHFAPAFVAGGVNLSGHSLVLFDGVQVGMGATHVAGRWLDRNGLPLSALFDAGTATGASDIGVQVDTVPLFDNSIAVRVNGVWALHVRDLSTAGSAVPSWMNSYAPGRGLRLLGGNRGYTSYSLGGEAAAVCAQDVKVLAPDGHLCGTVAFPISASACTTGPMSGGRDGTAIQGLPPECTGSGCTCTHRVWNGLFH